MSRYVNPSRTIATSRQTTGIFLQPTIPSDEFTWNEGWKLPKKNDSLRMLLTFEKEHLYDDFLVVTRLR
jgi:hypothetical protein